MDPITSAILEIAKAFGVSPVAALAMLVIFVRICSAVTRSIPDSATGWLHYVRVVTKFISFYVKDNGGSTRSSDGTEAPGTLNLTSDMRPDPFGRGAAIQQEKK